jgi:hypothetical protein
MRGVLVVLLFSGMALGQQPATPATSAPSSTPTPNDISTLAPAPTEHSEEGSNELTIPAGSQIPLTLSRPSPPKTLARATLFTLQPSFPS